MDEIDAQFAGDFDEVALPIASCRQQEHEQQGTHCYPLSSGSIWSLARNKPSCCNSGVCQK